MRAAGEGARLLSPGDIDDITSMLDYADGAVAILQKVLGAPDRVELDARQLAGVWFLLAELQQRLHKVSTTVQDAPAGRRVSP